LIALASVGVPSVSGPAHAATRRIDRHDRRTSAACPAARDDALPRESVTTRLRHTMMRRKIGCTLYRKPDAPMTYTSLATGLLLAAGRGSRFDPAGLQNKLLAPLADGTPVARAAARNLLASVPRVVAVVRPGAEALAHVLNDAGCEVIFSNDAERGMGASLAAGVRASADAEGWIVSLADMPWIAPNTIESVARRLDEGASIVIPVYRGQRGHPVGFGAMHGSALAALDGDVGARALLASSDSTKIEVDDAGVLADVDTPSDLQP
jgi:molybdenum cofactor cytidylyltransferase